MEQRLLCAFAHPDDESYGPAGTIREIATRPKGRVRIITATRGEAGSLGISKQYTRANLARIRQGELMTAVLILGAELRILGYPDGGVPQVDPDVAVSDLVREIRIFRPQVVMTFHPNGISGHPDHIAMSGFLKAAAAAAGDPGFQKDGPPAWKPSRLVYYSITETRGRAIATMRKIHTVPDALATITLDTSRHTAIHHNACRVQGTQVSFYERLQQMEGGLDRYWTIEHFVVDAFDGQPAPGRLADLFEGIDVP